MGWISVGGKHLRVSNRGISTGAGPVRVGTGWPKSGGGKRPATPASRRAPVGPAVRGPSAFDEWLTRVEQRLEAKARKRREEHPNLHYRIPTALYAALGLFFVVVFVLYLLGIW